MLTLSAMLLSLLTNSSLLPPSLTQQTDAISKSYIRVILKSNKWWVHCLLTFWQLVSNLLWRHHLWLHHRLLSWNAQTAICYMCCKVLRALYWQGQATFPIMLSAGLSSLLSLLFYFPKCKWLFLHFITTLWCFLCALTIYDLTTVLHPTWNVKDCKIAFQIAYVLVNQNLSQLWTALCLILRTIV